MTLDEYMKKHCISPGKFCRKLEISHASLHKYRRGGVPRLDIALKIVRATNGEVTIQDLCGDDPISQ